jgi:1-acyl-sn-glycerol-3-phosphate acyltransferase
MPRPEPRDRPATALYVFNAVTYLICASVVILWLPAMALLLLFTWPFDPNRCIAGSFLRLGAVLVARSFPLWDIRVIGEWPADGRSYVVVANHNSHADILLLSHMPREMKWMAKIDGFRLPWVGWLFRLAGDLPVHQGDSDAGWRTLRRAESYLRGGMSVMIFPEGKRNRGTLLPFKSGAFRLALQTEAAVLPVAITGTEEALRRDGWLLRPAELTARILDPVEVAGLGEADFRKVREEVRARIARALSASDSRTTIAKTPVPEELPRPA